MANTIKELREFLESYPDQDATVIWQFYVASDFYIDEDEGELTEDEFLEIKDTFEKTNTWDWAYEEIQNMVSDLQATKLEERDKNAS